MTLDGAFSGYLGSCVDVTEQRDAAEMLTLAKEELRLVSTQSARDAAMLDAVIGSLQDGVMAESDEGRITVANAAFCRMCGLPEDPGALIGRSAEDLRESLWKAFVADVPAFRRVDGRSPA